MRSSNEDLPLPDWEALSLEEQVAQLIVVRASGYLFDQQIQYPAWEPTAQQLQYWLQELAVGGVILLGGSAAELSLRSEQLQDWAKYPLLIAADIEEGVGQRFSGATWFPPPMAIGAVALKDSSKAQLYAQQMGAITAQEALSIGINWLLAPVVDVNNNPDNPVINVRAFADTPEVVSQLACAFIQGAKQYPVLTTAKHFPGHGDTAIDSHLELPVLPHSKSRLEQVELPPFSAAISSGVDAIMSAHLLIPAWDQQYPATLSKRVLTNLLRDNLGFEGLVVTDALVMGAIANRYGAQEAPLLALEAGADILLMPVDPETTIQAICAAVQAGRIPLERILSSVKRIWKAKAKVQAETDSVLTSLHQSLFKALAQPQNLVTTANILVDSQLVGGSLPLVTSSSNDCTPCNLILVDDSLVCEFLGRHTPAVAKPRELGYQLQLIDSHTPLTSEEVSELVASQPTLLQLFIRGNPFRGSVGLTPLAESLIKKLLRKGNLKALVIYGSPYMLKQFLPYLPKDLPYLFSYGQMPEAQATALETLFGQTVSVKGFTQFI